MSEIQTYRERHTGRQTERQTDTQTDRDRHTVRGGLTISGFFHFRRTKKPKKGRIIGGMKGRMRRCKRTEEAHHTYKHTNTHKRIQNTCCVYRQGMGQSGAMKSYVQIQRPNYRHRQTDTLTDTSPIHATPQRQTPTLDVYTRLLQNVMANVAQEAIKHEAIYFTYKLQYLLHRIHNSAYNICL